MPPGKRAQAIVSHQLAHAGGAGAFFRLKSVPSFLTVVPPNEQQ